MCDFPVMGRWLDVFDVVHSDPVAVGSLECPSCGARTLRMLYRVHAQERDKAMAMFWCDTCLNGLMPNTVRVPANGIRVEPGEKDDVPNYTLVQD